MTSCSWRCSRQTAEQESRIAHRVDPQANAAPLDGGALAGHQVFKCSDIAAIAGHADLDIAERQPELVRLARQRDNGDDAVGLIDRFLDEADDIAVLDRNKAKIAGLLQRRVFAA